MRVELPWPDKLLWPNGSEGNRYAKSGAKKAARHAASWAAIEARQRYGVPAHAGGDIDVTLYVHAKPRGPLPDKDNCVAAIKVQLDAIAEQIGANDRQFSAPRVVFCEPRDGRMVVELSPFVPQVREREGFTDSPESAKEKIGPSGATTPPARDQNAATGALR